MSIDLAIADAPATAPSDSSVTFPQRTASRSVSVAEQSGSDEACPSDADLEIDGAGQGRGVQSEFASTTVVAEKTAIAQKSLLSDFITLTKPRIVVMVLVTTVASAMVAAGGWFSLVDLVWLLVGTAMVAGSAGSANQVWERRIDCNMPRTAVRPLPSERMSVAVAVAFTALIGILGTAVLASAFGTSSALVGLATWGLYVLVYTPLKTRTAWNTTVGAVAGALPILIGYTALGGSLLDVNGWLLVGVLVTWQYPHFMAIAWMYRHQYAEAGFQMSTTVEPTGRSAGIQSVVGSLALIGCGLGLCVSPAQLPSTILSTIAIVAVVYPMLRASIRFARHRDDVQARRLLRSSLLVLPAVLLIVTLRVFW